jgi:hypothetical protein
MASAVCPQVRGVCIAGKPGSYSLRGLCWSRLACDGFGGVSVSSRRLHRGQARFLQLARALLELACLRWLRRGVSGFAVAASRARPAPTALRGLCWSRLACDGFGGVSVGSRWLHRGQARLLQLCAGSVGAGLPAMASAGCQWVRGVCIAGKPGSYSFARALLELACLRCLRRGVSGFAVSASRASPAPTALRGLCWSWLACDGVGGVPVSARWLHRGRARLLQVTRALLELACLRWLRRGVSGFAVSASRASPAPTVCAGFVGAGLPAMAAPVS